MQLDQNGVVKLLNWLQQNYGTTPTLLPRSLVTVLSG